MRACVYMCVCVRQRQTMNPTQTDLTETHSPSWCTTSRSTDIKQTFWSCLYVNINFQGLEWKLNVIGGKHQGFGVRASKLIGITLRRGWDTSELIKAFVYSLVNEPLPINVTLKYLNFGLISIIWTTSYISPTMTVLGRGCALSQIMLTSAC